MTKSIRLDMLSRLDLLTGSQDSDHETSDGEHKVWCLVVVVFKTGTGWVSVSLVCWIEYRQSCCCLVMLH